MRRAGVERIEAKGSFSSALGGACGLPLRKEENIARKDSQDYGNVKLHCMTLAFVSMNGSASLSCCIALVLYTLSENSPTLYIINN